MELIGMFFNHLIVHMLDSEEDDMLWTTSAAVCKALEIKKSALRNLYARNQDEFESVTLSDAKEPFQKFFQENKDAFDIRRMRKDTRLWSENDVILIAMLCRSSISKEFRREFVKYIKQNAINRVLKDFVTREEFEQLLEETAQLRGMLSGAQPDLARNASAAGAALRAHRTIRHLRRVK